ncbi:MAG TPA: hypothetical protein VIT91_21740 [Chthoniobacterales bacterium]
MNVRVIDTLKYFYGQYKVCVPKLSYYEHCLCVNQNSLLFKAIGSG